MRIIRWKYVAPRLILLVVVALGFRFGLDPLLKWAFVVAGEAAVGAKVDLAEVETSLRDGTVVFRGLAITNPYSPLQNLMQAERAELQLDMNALFHKRVVIRDGVVSGLQFDTDRAESGELAATTKEIDESPSVLSPWLESGNEMAEQWFDQLSDRLDTDLVEQLETPRVVEELEERWPQEYEQLRGRAKELQTKIKALEQGLRAVRKNPLRHLDQLGELQQQLVAMQRELQSLQQKIEQLPRQAENDQQSVLAAKNRDEQFLRAKLQVSDLNGAGLSETLLGETVNERLVSALEWIGWARRQIPVRAAAKVQAARGRGTTVLFSKARPRYLVERVQLEGLASLGGETLQIVGSLTDLTTEPHLVTKPARLSLQSSGASAFTLEATVDRREEVAVDLLQIDCPKFAVSGRALGKAEKLAIQLAPSTASVRVDLKLTDDQLAGEIVYSQPDVGLSLATGAAKSKQLALVLEQALAGVEQIDANVVLSGTLNKPKISLQSDLGPQLATSLNAAVRRFVQERGEQLLAETQQKVDRQLQRLDDARQRAQQELLANLSEDQEVLTQLAALSGEGTSGLSIPKLGQSLRAGTQLK